MWRLEDTDGSLSHCSQIGTWNKSGGKGRKIFPGRYNFMCTYVCVYMHVQINLNSEATWNISSGHSSENIKNLESQKRKYRSKAKHIWYPSFMERLKRLAGVHEVHLKKQPSNVPNPASSAGKNRWHSSSGLPLWPRITTGFSASLKWFIDTPCLFIYYYFLHSYFEYCISSKRFVLEKGITR